MQKIYADMTMSEVLSDPLILSVALADGLTPNEFKGLLFAAANRIEQSRSVKSTGGLEAASRGLLSKMITPKAGACFQAC